MRLSQIMLFNVTYLMFIISFGGHNIIRNEQMQVKKTGLQYQGISVI